MNGDSAVLLGAVGLIIATIALTRLVDRMFIRSVPRDMARWRDELERACIACLHADLNAAETKGHLAEMIGKVPADFNPSAFLGMQLAAGVQRAVLIEAERRGLVRAGMFASVYGMSVEQATVGGGVPAVVAVADTVPPPVPPREPEVEFIDGRPVPRGMT